MTQYFDAIVECIQKLSEESKNPAELAKGLDAIDLHIVLDVSVCSEFEGFPEDLRTRIHLTVIKYSAAAQPVNSEGPCYETINDHVKGMYDMTSDLHTIFHELCERDIPGFSDNPRTPIRRLYTRAEERREALVIP